MQDKVRNKLTLPQYENEVSWWVDVDVARAAGTAPLGGGAHSFGVGDRDRGMQRSLGAICNCSRCLVARAVSCVPTRVVTSYV